MLKCYLSWPTQSWFMVITICVGCASADILVFNMTDSHKVLQGFRDLPARFGGMIPAAGIKGLVVYADPPQACSDIKGPPNNEKYYGYNWIVLIARFNCTFEDKIRNAQKAGYDAAIVHNVKSDDLEPMSAKDAGNVIIPSVFVSEFTGSILQNVYRYDEDCFILINDLPLNINTHLLLPFAIVVGICFLVMVIFMVIRCIKDRRRQRRYRLPNSSLKKIPTHKYAKDDPYDTCAICLDDYVENEKLRILPCAHAYHSKCIDPWLTKKRRVCPVCKRKVFAADEHYESDTESDSDADDSTPLIIDGSRPGTQGGTFTRPSASNPFTRPSASNPFWRQPERARQHHQARRDSQNSASSNVSAATVGVESAAAQVTDESDDVEGPNNAEESVHPAFVAMLSHSINGELPDLEKSVSSTKPHTVNLSTEVEDNFALDVNQEVTHERSPTRAGAINSLSTTVVPRTSDDNDIII